MNKKLLLVLPLVLLAAGCATCSKSKMQNLEARVNALENKSGEATRTETPVAATMETQATSASAVNEAAIPETPTKKDIQISLKNAGFYTGEIDEKFGHKTKKAVEEFQKANGLKVDGKVGPNTWNKLKTYYTASATETK
jgi:peptidoglycan hydrolase-like protein with peptidoglycan-binding domain